MEYDKWHNSGLKKELAVVRGHNVEPKSQSIFYSGPIDKHGDQGIRNSERALRYAQREGVSLIQTTDRGSYLSSRQRIIGRLTANVGEFSPALMRRYEWGLTSRSYAELAHGHVKAFVAGAGREDIFRNLELETLISNSRVKSINGIKRTKLAKILANNRDAESKDNRAKEKGLDIAYHIVANAGARQDLQQALRTGDRELIRDALAQMQLCQNQKRLDSGLPLDESEEAKTNMKTKLDRRADHIAAVRQAIIRREAMQEVKTYAGALLKRGAITNEQAESMTLRTEQTTQNPREAYRVRELTRLKLMRDNAVQSEPNIRGFNNYLSAKERYEQDMRAIRQFNKQPFVESSPAERELYRHESQGNLTGKPKSVSHKRRRQRRKPQTATRTGAHRPRAHISSHRAKLSHH